MGYTRYWERTDKDLTENFIEAVKEIIADCESKGIHICGGYGGGEPIVRLDKVWINGDASKDLDHETIYFDNDPSEFQFCKTCRKPYDYVLRRILEVAESEGLVTDIRSDMNYDEIKNDEGKIIGSYSMTVSSTEAEEKPSEVFKVRMTKTIELFIKAEDEDMCMDFMRQTELEDVMDMADNYSVDYDEEIICSVREYADLDLTKDN